MYFLSCWLHNMLYWSQWKWYTECESYELRIIPLFLISLLSNPRMVGIYTCCLSSQFWQWLVFDWWVVVLIWKLLNVIPLIPVLCTQFDSFQFKILFFSSAVYYFIVFFISTYSRSKKEHPSNRYRGNSKKSRSYN